MTYAKRILIKDIVFCILAVLMIFIVTVKLAREETTAWYIVGLVIGTLWLLVSICEIVSNLRKKKRFRNA